MCRIVRARKSSASNVLVAPKPTIPLAAIDDLTQALVKRHSLEADGWVQEVTSQAFHFFMIFGLHRDPVVNGESTVLPRIEQLDTLVGE